MWHALIFGMLLALASAACSAGEPATGSGGDSGAPAGRLHGGATGEGGEGADTGESSDGGESAPGEGEVTEGEGDGEPGAEGEGGEGSDAGDGGEGSDAGDGGGGPHPAGWSEPGNANFHGTPAKRDLISCSTCHGADLTGGTAGSCEQCHSGWKNNCTFCHGGTDTQLGSPPVDTAGNAATTEVTVGAHSSHVLARSGIAAALDCTSCHAKPADALAAGHIDPAPAETIIPGWDRSAATCANVYCHGNFTGGKTGNAPQWTRIDGTQAACGACHDLPPRTGRHPSAFGKHAWIGQDCTQCHQGLANNGATAILDPARHVNGTIDVNLPGGSWNPATKSCDPSCHGKKSW